MNKIYGIPDKDYFFDNWIVIILAIYFFFPIGFFLLFRKIKLHRRNLFTSGKIAIGIGIFMICIGLLIIFGITTTPIDSFVIDILYGFTKFLWYIGFIVLTIGILTRLTAKRYQKYINLVVNEKITDLDVIATRMKCPKNTVINYLYKLIEKRYLEDYVIELEKNKIYHLKEQIEAEALEKIKTAEKERYTRIIICRNCGANNLIDERIGKCRYCNSYIE